MEQKKRRFAVLTGGGLPGIKRCNPCGCKNLPAERL